MADTCDDPAFAMPRVRYAPTTPRHTLENTGDEPLVVIGVELKGATPA